MIRIRVRHGDSKKKVLWFDQSIEFPLLLRKICNKLGVNHVGDNGDIDLRDLFRLKLEDDDFVIIDDTDVVEYGDELVLEERSSVNEDERKPRARTKKNYPVDNQNQKNDVPNASHPVKEEYADHSDASEDSVHVKKEEASDSDVISISSDDDDDDSSYGDNDNDVIEYDSSSSEEMVYSPRRKRAKPNTKKEIEPPLEVLMKNHDIPSAPGRSDRDSDNRNSEDEMEEKSMLVNRTGKKQAEEEIKLRIIKLLNTGFHDQSNEHEAKNAMKLAQRLMRKHNLSQALLLKEREMKNSQATQDDEVLKGGMVTVEIINRKTRKPFVCARWILHLAHPVCDNFGVKHYYSNRRSKYFRMVFYGIYSNAQLAGYAFKVAAERISQMMAEYQPQKSWQRISTKSSRLSYAIGIVEGISDDVERNLQMEKEQRKRKLERARLAESKGEAYEESDDEDFDTGNDGAGISLVKEESLNTNDDDSRHPAPSKERGSQSKSLSGADLQNRVEELEKEEQAALVLVDHNQKVAEEVLEEQGIKLSSGRKRKPIQFDNQSYRKGIEDSREIDINQRAIRDEVKVKVEKR